jgi:hypothetical protein
MSAGSYDEKIAARQASERARVKAEQDRANAQARGYNGMCGDAFKKADAKKLRKLSEKAYAGEELSERQQDKFQYLASAQQGYVAEGKTVEERGERAKELLDYLE